MRRAPCGYCGCAPYGEGAFHIRRARPLGVPSAKRQTVQTNGFVRIWQFLHRRAESSRPTACRPRSGRRYKRTDPYALGSSCTGGDMSPPYRGAAVHVREISASLRYSQSTREKRTTINETAPVGLGHVQADREAADSWHEQVCTYLVVPTPARRVVAPYGEGAFHIRRARPLGVPTAKRQTVRRNEFVRIW